MKRLSFAAVVALLAGCSSVVGYFVLPKEGIREARYRVAVERDAGFVTSDGVRLAADIYRPRTLGKTPTILVRIPVTHTFKNELAIDVVGGFWASRGYTAVVQGTRGRYRSGGQFYPLRHELQDGRETLQWLARQPWFDGRLGMWGGSAFGHTQWVLADQADPGPKALIVQIASTSFREMFHPGGAFSLESALFWAARSHGPQDRDPVLAELKKGFAGFPLIEADDRSVGNVAFFNDWLRHSRAEDDYWRSIDGPERARTLRAPALLMAGWYDPFLPTQLRDFQTIRREADPRIALRSRLIIGPWTHADPVVFPDGSTAEDYRPASLAPSLPWFDHHLLGQPLDPSLHAPVRIFVMGENRWREEQAWPLERARYVPYYLGSDGTLSADRTQPVQVARSFVYDPRDPVPSRGGAMLGPRAGIALQNDVEARADVLVYSTEVLAKDLEVTGPVSAVLYVSTTAAHTDFTVKLVDAHPDGKAYNVSDGILRRPYAAGRVQQIVVELWPTSMLFRSGHRIRVEVSSSNYPRYDRNPNTGGDIPTETRPVPATQTVHHGDPTHSRIILPVVPRDNLPNG